MKRLLWAPCFAIALTGCGESAPPKPKMPSTDKVVGAVKDVANKAADAAKTVADEAKKKFESARETFTKEVNANMPAAEKKIAELKTKAAAATGDAKAKLEAQAKSCDEKLKTLRDKLSGLAAGTPETWDALKKAVSDAWDDLKKAME
ncbi:MAG: hypothetical protein K1X57_08180 [Gemmataceae bacterium]|nr:hypothetical protein [Gemmataceae bacterium]